MNSKTLMIASSLFTGLLGIAGSFLPKEVLNNIGATPTELSTFLVQITGALYLGFAMMNWMAKTVLIGGIYARPLAMGNFLHFAVASIALVKGVINNPGSKYILIASILYLIFAILFAVVLFRNPAKK